LDINEFAKKSIIYGIDYFLYSLNSLIDDKIKIVKQDLDNSINDFNLELIEDIATRLTKLRKKESSFIKFISTVIGIDANSSRQKDRLRVLLDTLDIEFNKLEKSIKENSKEIEDLNIVVDELRELKSRFIYLSREQNVKRLNFYLNEIDEKVKILEAYIYTLLLKEVNLLKQKEIYINLAQIKQWV